MFGEILLEDSQCRSFTLHGGNKNETVGSTVDNFCFDKCLSSSMRDVIIEKVVQKEINKPTGVYC